jgi:cell wall-associated NlpC family hydrolase
MTTTSTRYRIAAMLAVALSFTGVGTASAAAPSRSDDDVVLAAEATQVLARITGETTATTIGGPARRPVITHRGTASDFRVLAELIAAEEGANATRLVAAWTAADTEHQIAFLTAVTQLGVPYRKNSDDPARGFDCSGFTAFAWSAAGVSLKHQSSAQIRTAEPTTLDDAQPGDLVQYPGHVMLYVGVDELVIHAPAPGDVVQFADVAGNGKTERFGDPTG